MPRFSLLSLTCAFALVLAGCDRESTNTAQPEGAGAESGEALTGKVDRSSAGEAMPAAELTDPTGAKLALASLTGKPVLVNLWATWCPPCRAEMKSIEKVYNEYKEQGLVVLAVNMTYQDDPTKIAPFVAEQGLTFPILLDETGDAGHAYQLRSLPSSFFIGRDGIIREVVIGGPMAEALLRTRIEEILK